MEYLMTYGWAILVIAVVLGALFQLGVFSSATFGPQGCIGQPDFSCTSATMNALGYLTVDVGSAVNITVTGVSCTSTNVAPSSFLTPATTPVMTQGQTATVSFSCSLPTNGVIGTPFSGYLWLQYDYAGQTGLVSLAAVINARTSTFAAVGSFTIPFTYAYATNDVINNVGPASANAPAGYATYLCAAGFNQGFYSWTADAVTSTYSAVGHQSSNSCSGSNQYQNILAVGVSQSSYTLYSASASNTISYSVISASQESFILVGTVPPIATMVSLPSGCSQIVNSDITAENGYSVYLAVCNGQSPGQYTFTAQGTSASTSIGPYTSWAVYVFG
jgi:hypothetical protein